MLPSAARASMARPIDRSAVEKVSVKFLVPVRSTCIERVLGVVLLTANSESVLSWGGGCSCVQVMAVSALFAVPSDRPCVHSAMKTVVGVAKV